MEILARFTGATLLKLDQHILGGCQNEGIYSEFGQI